MTSPNGGTSARGRTLGRTVVGLFRDRSRAQDAVRDLKQAGFTNEQIGLATRDRSEPGPGRDEVGKIGEQTGTGLEEGATVGALTGGVIGGLVGLIGSLLIPGLGPVLVGGVLASTLMGAGLGAATGGLIGALVGMGVPEEDAKYFDTGLREGGTLVTVNASDGIPEALAILQRYEADLGPTKASKVQDRRSRHDASYSGPERRLVGV